MITVIVSWCYIFMVCLLLGAGASALLEKISGKQEERTPISLLVILGVVVSTVYTEYLSCFMKIGMMAHLILVMLAILCGVLCRKTVGRYLNAASKLLFSWEGLFYIGFLFFIAYFTSRGEFHTDTNIYHAQNIRLYEEYGLIKGMGNLQLHFAYNSAYLAFAAIFSMKWLLGQSLHTTTGFLEAFLCIYAFYGLKRFRQHERHWADFTKIGILFYVLVILARSMSPATDFGTMLIALYILVAWCDNLENEKSVYIYSLLSIIAVFVLTMKFSACFLVLLAIYPAIIMIKNKKWKMLGLCFVSGAIILIPFLMRNFLISGWLLYPFDKIDLFNVEWKIPREYLLEDSAQITVWARCLYNTELIDMPVLEWVPIWWEGQFRYEQMFLGSAIIGTVLLVVQFLQRRFQKKKMEWDAGVLLLTIYMNIVLWFCIAPFIRYSLAFLFMIPLLAIGEWGSEEKKGFYSLISGGLVFCIVICLSPYWDHYITDGGVFIKQHLRDKYYLKQQDYDLGNMDFVEINGNKIYYDETYNEVNSYFTYPSTCYPQMLERTTLMGDSITDGFKAK